MEEPTKLEQPSESGVEASNLDPPISPQSSTSIVQSESSKTEDVSPNSTKSLELDETSPSSPKQCESPGDGQDCLTNKACQSSNESINAPTSSHSSGELDIPKSPEPTTSIVETTVESSSLPQASTVGNVKCSDPTKCEVVGVESPNPPKTSEMGADLSKPPSESGGESPECSTLPSESGIESPKSPYPSESSIESPKSMASNESGELTGSDAKSMESGDSPKSGSSDSRRKSKLLATYSMKNEAKVKLLANQLELVASEREKDVLLKQEYKEKEESLKDKRESIYKQMHIEERKAKMDRKASTRKGSNFRIDLNASKRDLRKDDLNRKKEEDERNKQLLLQRARDEKMLRKSIYATNKTSSASSSPNSSSPPPDEKD